MTNVVILAGGFGTRISEYTETIPKPMVPIGNKPIIWHIMNNFSCFGLNNFYLALGYKSEKIKEYFINYHYLNSDLEVNLSSGKIKPLNEVENGWNVSLIDTGLKTMTGGRVKKIFSHMKKEKFILTYGDALSNVNIDSLLKFHDSHKKMVTVTAVRPSARFGEIDLDEDKVISFKEKPRTKTGWINGGFFIMEPEFVDFIKGDETVLEKSPLELAAENDQLMAFKHEGFWQCMDTKRDHESLENLWSTGSPPWLEDLK
ncbi:glucose-1-phosphate cytidylyltransferase [Gammaproteobacteria bacterium]|nr:glucose-1-phosphate cytidylyltransferase [Gammaproteobacteria bacterium]